MLAIIDYGMGNLRSVAKAFQRLGNPAVITADPKTVLGADKLVLPGVGHFKQGMQNITGSKMQDALQKKVMEDKCPILGICLGMQLFSKYSAEGHVPGLGWIEAETLYFREFVDAKIKVPHMGWNTISISKESKLMKGIPENAAFYFVHSYFFKCNQPSDILARTEYGITFTSAVEKENIFAVQFHPEKSHDAGLQLLSNFLNI
jgi:imidazole glycerol-phosphate synthase subunit HisH